VNSEPTLTVSELAAIVADPALNDDVHLVTRQIRNWSTIGLLKPAGGPFTGRGKHRRYELEEVYRTGLLVRFAALGLPTAALSALNEYFDQISERRAIDILDITASMTAAQVAKYRREEWRWVTERSASQFLAFRFVQNPRADVVERAQFWCGTWTMQPEIKNSPETFGEGLPPDFAEYGAPAIFINLTELFRRLTARIPK
jgi:DNA-binding transcriptional MerR regulator